MINNIFIAQISGGKDSFRMLDLLANDKHRKIDAVICCDTGYEFGLMYDFWDKMHHYFKSKYGIDITFLGRDGTGKEKFDRMMFGKFKETKKLSEWKRGRFRGYPQSNTPCFGHRDCKIGQTHEYVNKMFKGKNVFFYIGIAADEPKRIRSNGNLIYPLHEAGITEPECLEYNKSIDMHNPLYDHFDRTGCYHCPKQTKKKFEKIRDNFPEEWVKLITLNSNIHSIRAYNTQIRHGLELLDLM